MAFPVVAARITGRTNNTNTTTHAITLPAGVVAGNLLVVVFSTDGNPTVTAQQAGWTLLSQASNGTVVTGAVFWKVATGSDALTLTTSAAEASSHASFRITGGDAPTGTSAVATSTNTNPPSHTPPNGTRDYLWIVTRAADSTNVATAAPTNYTNLQTQAAQGTNGASTNTAERSLNAAGTDPGTFTSGTSIAWQSWTLAIPPITQSLIPVVVASTATVGAPSVVQPQSVVPVVVASTASVATPITSAKTFPAQLAAASTVATPTATTTVSLIPALLGSSATIGAPVVIGEQRFTAVLLTNAATVATPTVATYYPVTIASTASVTTPSLATHYPVTIASTASVATPLITLTVAATALVNKPTLLTTSTSLAPSPTLLPSEGGDRFFPPTATVNLFQTTLPELIDALPPVREPTVLVGGITTTPATVASAAQVLAPTLDTITRHRRPLTIGRAIAPSPARAPSTSLRTAGPRDQVELPQIQVGSPQTVELVALAATSTVFTPVARPITLPALLASAATVYGPTPRAAVLLEIIPGLPSTGVTLYPGPDLYPGTDLYPFRAQVPYLAAATATSYPVVVPAGSGVFAPTLSGSGVNDVPTAYPELLTSTAAVFAPQTSTQQAVLEIELLDTGENVELPYVLLPGQILAETALIASTSTVGLPVVAPRVVAVMALIPATGGVIVLPRSIVLAATAQGRGAAYDVAVGVPTAWQLAAGAPTVIPHMRVGTPVLI